MNRKRKEKESPIANTQPDGHNQSCAESIPAPCRSAATEEEKIETQFNDVALTSQANTDVSQAMPTSGEPGAPETNSDVTYFHVQANANCYAVADLVVTAKDERQAKRKAQQILECTRFQVTGHTRLGAKVFASLMQENVEVEILEIQDHDSELPPVEEDAVRARTEAKMGRRLLLEMERLEINKDGLDVSRENIRAGLGHGMAATLFQDLWQLYQEVHPEQALPKSKLEPGLHVGSIAALASPTPPDAPERPPTKAVPGGMRARLMERRANDPKRQT